MWLHRAAQLNGYARVQSMDEPTHETDGSDELTLHDCLAAPGDDPATAAARRLDWEPVIEALDRTANVILLALLEGRELTLLVRRLKRSRSSMQDSKVRYGSAYPRAAWRRHTGRGRGPGQLGTVPLKRSETARLPGGAQGGVRNMERDVRPFALSIG